MKVGTDSVLLGAWAKGGRRILDVGAGTGVIALMMAQRFPQAEVMAVDIDGEACAQAVENVAASPFAGRVDVRCVAVQQLAADEAMQARFDAIVSNPPFFDNALKAKGESRLIARHTDTLPFAQLFAAVRRLLAPSGVFSAIIPFKIRVRGVLGRFFHLWGVRAAHHTQQGRAALSPLLSGGASGRGDDGRANS